MGDPSGYSFDSCYFRRQAIKEEDRRKGLIEKLGQSVSNQDRLTVYIRGTDQPETVQPSRGAAAAPALPRKQQHPGGTAAAVATAESPEEKLLPPFAPRRKTSDVAGPAAGGDAVTDKIDIDSDNIETPPTSRRQIVRPQAAAAPSRIQTVEEETLGDGQFDRFSAARRTRRYRKTADDDQGRKSSEGRDESPREDAAATTTDGRPSEWKDKLLAYRAAGPVEVDGGGKDFTRNRLYSSMPRTSTRNQSVVDHGDIMKAVKIYGQLTPDKGVAAVESAGRRDRNHPRVTKISLHENSDPSSVNMMKSTEFIPEIRVQALTPPTKIRTEHDLNDEGYGCKTFIFFKNTISTRDTVF